MSRGIVCSFEPNQIPNFSPKVTLYQSSDPNPIAPNPCHRWQATIVGLVIPTSLFSSATSSKPADPGIQQLVVVSSIARSSWRQPHPNSSSKQAAGARATNLFPPPVAALVNAARRGALSLSSSAARHRRRSYLSPPPVVALINATSRGIVNSTRSWCRSYLVPVLVLLCNFLFFYLFWSASNQ